LVDRPGWFATPLLLFMNTSHWWAVVILCSVLVRVCDTGREQVIIGDDCYHRLVFVRWNVRPSRKTHRTPLYLKVGIQVVPSVPTVPLKENWFLRSAASGLSSLMFVQYLM
jgi:hypothetical protein